MQELNNIRLEEIIDIDEMKRLLNSFVLATGLGAMCVNVSGRICYFSRRA